MRSRLTEWVRRYAPLEAASMVAALAGGWLAAAIGASTVTVSFAAAWSENIGYYAVAFARELRRIGTNEAGVGFAPRALEACRRLIWEFGVAEVLDSFIVRPFAIWSAIALTGHTGWGIVVGKLAADAAFYAVAVVFYERSKTSR
ncbi:MAG TPA: hypothetical protein PK970_04155 [Hyphomicrobiaceae bacterium]|nr:hypothetical protein [Hyphomicrobiaceae bacterium]